MNLELNGTILKIGDTQTFGSGFQKRTFVLETNEMYPQKVELELLGDKIDIIEAFKVGDYVNVGINIRGREWTNPQGEVKYFNSIVAWKIVKQDASQPSPTTSQAPTGKIQPNNENPFEEEGDDLPF